MMIRKIYFNFLKNIWVKNYIFEYGLSCKKISGGSFYIRKNNITSYYNGNMDSKLEQLKDRAKQMGFIKGFWFLLYNSYKFDFNFHYEKIIY